MGGIIGVIVVLYIAATASPFILGAGAVFFGIYQWIHLEGTWALGVGVSCTVGGVIFILIQLFSRAPEQGQYPEESTEPTNDKKTGAKEQTDVPYSGTNNSQEKPDPAEPEKPGEKQAPPETKESSASGATEQNNEAPRVILQRLNVSIDKDKHLVGQGKLIIEGRGMELKPLLFKTKQILRFEDILRLEHRGKKLVIHLPYTYFTIQFINAKKEDTLRYKIAFSQITGKAIEGDPDTFVLEWSHITTAGMVLFFIFLMFSKYSDGLGCSKKSIAPNSSSTQEEVKKNIK